MKYTGTVTIETERLRLRRYRPEDADDVFRNWAASETVTKYLTWPPYADVEGVRGYISSVIESYQDERCFNWAIALKDSDEAIGSMSVVEYRDDTACAELGYCLGDAFWGNGYMTEAVNAAMRYLIFEVGFNRIQAVHDVNNPASGRVMEKCGLRYEGTLRQEGKNNQGVCDTVIRAVLREDLCQ